MKSKECDHPEILPINENWARCTKCGDDTFPVHDSRCDQSEEADTDDDLDEQDVIAEKIRAELLGLYEAERDERIAKAELRLATAQAECTREKHAAHAEYGGRVAALSDARRRERAS